MWTYRARCLRVIDGDTIKLYVDKGFDNYMILRVRLLGVNCPEIGTPGYKEAKAFTYDWMESSKTINSDDWTLTIETKRLDAFGRYLARVRSIKHGSDLSEDLITKNHGVMVKF